MIFSFQVFDSLFCLQVEEDVNEVVFGLCSESSTRKVCLSEAACKLDKLLVLKQQEMSQSIVDAAKKIRQLK